MKLVGYKATSVCAECEGGCCKTAPGLVYPEDIGTVTAEEIALLLKTGRYAIDFWTEIERDMTLFLRPRTQDGSMVVPFSEWGGRCTFLTESGCELPFRERPRGCRMLQPGPTNKDECDLHGHDKEHGKNAWMPFQAMITSALDELGEDLPAEPDALDCISTMMDHMFDGKYVQWWGDCDEQSPTNP